MAEIHAKLTGLSDIDWSELADRSGLGIHPDQLRKMGAGIRLASKAGVLNLYGSEAPYGSVGTYRDLQKLRDLHREINETARAEARSEALREAVIQAAGNLPAIQITSTRYEHANNSRSLVLAMGDFHYGAQWKVKGLYGEVVNAYSPEIFAQRMESLLIHLYSIVDKENVRHIDIMLCGDSLDGMLRASQLMKLRWGVVESCMRLSEYLVQWIATLAGYANVSVSVYGVDGNHGEIRPLGSKRGEFENENFEKI